MLNIGFQYLIFNLQSQLYQTTPKYVLVFRYNKQPTNDTLWIKFINCIVISDSQYIYTTSIKQQHIYSVLAT